MRARRLEARLPEAAVTLPSLTSGQRAARA
jgi:hypothetical protein